MRILALCIGLLLSTAALAGSATVTWTLPPTCADGSPTAANCPTTGFRVHTGTCGQPKTTVAANAGPTATTATVSNLTPGKQCFDLTTLAGSGESAHTNEVSVTIVAPLPSPPGNVTIAVLAADNTAYKMRQAVDGFQMVKIGTVPIGTSCDSTHNVDGYSLIQRSNVALTSRFDTMPLVVYAKCG
jgi:hypothetical protein